MFVGLSEKRSDVHGQSPSGMDDGRGEIPIGIVSPVLRLGSRAEFMLRVTIPFFIVISTAKVGR